MLDRCILTAQPVLIVGASDSAQVVALWNMPEVRDAVQGTPAFLSTTKEGSAPHLGMPIPTNGYQFTIYLAPGEELWGRAYDEALLGLSIGREV